VIVAIAQFLGAFSGIVTTLFPPKTHVEVAVSIQSSDFMTGNTRAVKPLAAIKGDPNNIDQIAKSVAKEIVQAIGPTQDTFEAILNIEGHTLRSSQPLQAAVLVFVPPMMQVGRIPKALGDATGVNLLPLFADSQFLNPQDKSIDMELAAHAGGFEPKPLKIFARNQIFSFDTQQQITRKTVQFVARKLRVVLESFDANGPSSENARTKLDSALRRELGKLSFLELSSLTLDGLKIKQLEIQHLAPGGAKSQRADQFRVDYVISGSLASK
jgi:hypothetical protein